MILNNRNQVRFKARRGTNGVSTDGVTALILYKYDNNNIDIMIILMIILILIIKCNNRNEVRWLGKGQMGSALMGWLYDITGSDKGQKGQMGSAL